jgi:hypothetical protein
MYALASGAVLCCLTAAILGTGCGSNGEAATEERIRQERADARADGRREERLREIERELRERERDDERRGAGGRGHATPAPSTGGGNCGDGVTAGPNTTCPFARNVRDDYYASGGDPVLRVHSPVTGRMYTMTCDSSSPHACTGGNDASVTFP